MRTMVSAGLSGRRDGASPSPSHQLQLLAPHSGANAIEFPLTSFYSACTVRAMHEGDPPVSTQRLPPASPPRLREREPPTRKGGTKGTKRVENIKHALRLALLRSRHVGPTCYLEDLLVMLMVWLWLWLWL